MQGVYQSTVRLVEPRGFEPLTPCLQSSLGLTLCVTIANAVRNRTIMGLVVLP